MRPFAPLLCVLALALVACGDDDEDSGSGGSGGGSARDEPEEPSAAEQPAEGGCKDVPQPEPRPDGGAKRPTGRLEPGTT